jgi:hypothetical protein
MRHALTDDGELREPATGTAEPVAQHLPTEIRVAVHARGARAARPERLHRDEVTDRDRGDVAPHFDDLARELVPDDRRERRRAHRAHEVLVQVGPAQTVVQ